MGALIGYARVSTRDQNLNLQCDALAAAVCLRVFTDKGTGADNARPGLQAALSHLRPGDTLIVWKLDRLGRNLRGLLELLADLERNQINFRSLTEGIDTTTAMGRFFFSLSACFAEMERELIRERTRAGLAAARAGGRIGGRRRVFSDRKVRAAIECYRAGMSTREICESFKCSPATLYRYIPSSARQIELFPLSVRYRTESAGEDPAPLALVVTASEIQ